MIDHEDLTSRLRTALAGAGNVGETRMFGGTCFMLDGNMVACASRRGFLFRVGKDGYPEALKRPGARPMEMRGRAMEGYVFVDPAEVDEAALADWLARAVGFVRTLPAKDRQADQQRPTRGKVHRK